MAETEYTESGKIRLDFDDPATLLARKPKKSILKMKHEGSQEREKHAGFDEMNILATYHPADKDYGTMKIEEPKTPYHHEIDSEPDECTSTEMRGRRVSLGSAVDPEALAYGLAHPAEKPLKDESEEEEDMTEEQKAKKRDFEKKRRAHYNEGAALKAHISVDDEDEDEAGQKMES